MFNAIRTWWKNLFASPEVVPDNVYHSCWEHNPNKDAVEGCSDDDRGDKAPACVAKSQIL